MKIGWYSAGVKNFWQSLPKPFFVMAPMADVTDLAWRALVAKCGAPDVFWTEFVSADGLYHTRTPSADGTTIYGSDAANPLMRDLLFGEGQHPIVAQFFTAKPEKMAYVSKLAEELGFDGVDINMGCPDATIEKQGAGAALIKTPEVAQAVIRAAQGATSLPVSVKTRIGFNTEALDEWLPKILETRPAALTVHLRTRKEMSLVLAHWDLMLRVVALRDALSPETLVIGNGDVKDLGEAHARVVQTGCDGVMIGRGMFGNPWVFAGRSGAEVPFREKAVALVELAYAFEKLSPPKSFHILKKHIKAFVPGFDGAAQLRAALMETTTAAELEAALATSQV